MICPKTKSANHFLTELLPIYQNKHWTIRRRNDRSLNPPFYHRIILKIDGFLVSQAALVRNDKACRQAKKYLMTVWKLPDDCMTTAWWLPDNCLMIAWQLTHLALNGSQDDKQLHAYEQCLWACPWLRARNSQKIMKINIHLQYERIWNGILWLLWGIRGQDECQPHLKPEQGNLLRGIDNKTIRR